MRQAGTIQSFEFSELIVPAKPGVINSAGLDKPLHMLPVGAQSGWSVQFDQLPKLVSHDLLRSPLKIEPPFAYVPEGPGLGIELDEAAMAEYRLDRRIFE